MNLLFERVLEFDENKIAEIYNIIKLSGKYMSEIQGLVHWKDPFPIESINKNCADREVFIVKDLDLNRYVHTFQLEIFKLTESTEIIHCDPNEKIKYIAKLYKFATLPEAAGRGIGKASMEYMENYCRSKNCVKLIFDVYDKSEHAIRFYQNRGFSIVGSEPTKHFTVLLMEKEL